jgi:hypothetical protein
VLKSLITLAALGALCALLTAPSVAIADITAGAYPRNVVQGGVFHVCCESGPRGRVYLGLARLLYDPTPFKQHIPPLKDLTEALPDPAQDHPRNGSYGFRVPDVPPGNYGVVLSEWDGWNGLGWNGDIPSELHVAPLPSTSTSSAGTAPDDGAISGEPASWPLLLGAGAAGSVFWVIGRRRRSMTRITI